MKKPAPKSAATKPVKKAALAKKVPAKKPAAPAKKKSAVAEPPSTFISAQIDIGFGNHLTLRGEGPGLSWDKGLVMDNVGHSLWTASISKATKPVAFKLLVNDLSWSTGPDFVVEPGQSITVYPSF
ncbi:MAG: hypothetical protein QG602_2239 [Verrucomicrobiota bacterium]|nr:hypothetical protein [Verrucomicrobiota bacterium]